MKFKFTLILLIGIFVNLKSYAVIDTLREYTPSKVTTGYFNPAVYFEQYQRFDLPAPGYIKAIVLTLGGTDSTGSVTLHIFGHEGGESFPEIQTDLITPVQLLRTTKVNEKVTYTLPSPVWVDNNQFFIKINDFSSKNVHLLRENLTHTPACSSVNGGDYYYTFLVDTANNAYYGTYSLAIDVVMDYTEGKVSPQYFQDVTAAAGIDSNLSNNYVAWSDINNDHYPDLLVSGHLYKNNGNGTFSDITSSSGVTYLPYIATFIDMNNDGKDDILSLGYTPGDNAIYINQGNETFVKSALNIPLPGNIPISSFGIADWNNDGYPDLFVGYLWTSSDTLGYYAEKYYNYHLFMNDGNLGFKDTSSVIVPDYLNYNFPGFAPDILGTTRCTRGAQWCDYNDDGKMDLYIANYRLMQDNLWSNNGNGTFTDVAYSKDIDVDSQGGSGHGTGVDWGDYDNDGYMDLLLPQLAHQTNTVLYDDRPTTLYKNTGAPDFDFINMNPGVNKGLGIEYEETHAGANWGDINNDGLLDFAICAFYGCRFSDIYLQKPDHTFEMKTFDYGMTDVEGDEDVTLVDFDNDGRLDLACANGAPEAAHFRLYKNNGPSQNYVALELVSTSGNKQAVDAKVTVYAGGNQFTRYQMPYHGALRSDGNRIHVGIGYASAIDSVTVRWPNGTTNSEKFTGVAINTWNTLVEGGTVIIGMPDFQTSTKVSIYPNPTGDMLNIALNNSSFDKMAAMLHSGWKVEIRNLLGQTVLTNEASSSLTTSTIDVSGLTKGLYFVNILTKEANFVKSFVKD